MKLEMKQIERLLLVKVGICDGGSLFPLQITSLLALLRQLRQENLDLNNGGEEEEEGVEEWNVFAVDRKDVAISVCVFVSPLLRYSLGTFFLGKIRGIGCLEFLGIRLVDSVILSIHFPPKGFGFIYSLCHLTQQFSKWNFLGFCF